MAFNRGIEHEDKSNTEWKLKMEKDVEDAITLHVDLGEKKPVVEEEKAKFDNSVALDGSKKEKYYMEWWEIGTSKADIEAGEFHSSNIKHFIKTFLGFQKYTVVYLKRCRDNAVMKDARSTLR